eukprot:COSAG06_NODE_60170_length_271_cov_7.488372_1_plen_77_part_01
MAAGAAVGVFSMIARSAFCAGQMMQGSGEGLPDTIPNFTGTDLQFWVTDPSLSGGGFMDTLSNTWGKVKKFVSDSPL